MKNILMHVNVKTDVHKEEQNHEVYVDITDHYWFVRKLIELYDNYDISKRENNITKNKEINTIITMNNKNEVLGIQTNKHFQLLNIALLKKMNMIIKLKSKVTEHFKISLVHSFFDENTFVISLPEQGIFIINRDKLKIYVENIKNKENNILIQNFNDKNCEDNNNFQTNENKKFFMIIIII